MGPECLTGEWSANKTEEKFEFKMKDCVNWEEFLDGVWGEQKEAWDSLKGTGKEALKTGLKPRKDI